MLGRRSFLIACSWIVTAPALAKEASFLATSNPPRTPLVDPVPPQRLTNETQLEGPVLQIQGWDTPFVTDQSSGNQVWIRVNQSWRTAWR
jgi:hypothetical protein